MASDTKSLEPDGATGTESEGNAEQGPSPRRDTGPLHLETAFGDATFMAEGDADMVLRAFESFKAHDAAHHRQRTPAKSPAEPPADKTDKTDADKTDTEASRKTENLPLPAFLKQFQLKTNFETAVAIAVWASRQPNGPRQFDKDSLAKFWGASGEKVPGNVGAELNRATLRGWMTRASRGKFDLVAYGEEYVDKTLARKKPE